jgi:hypothetical protein
MGDRNEQMRRGMRVGAQRTHLRWSVAGPGVAANVIAAVLGLLGAFTLHADEPVAPPTCAMRLPVEVTPDVPNPSDGSFISSLLGDHAGYQLFLLQVVDDTHVILQLQGPGSADRCQAVVDSMRSDGRVLSIQAS